MLLSIAEQKQLKAINLSNDSRLGHPRLISNDGRISPRNEQKVAETFLAAAIQANTDLLDDFFEAGIPINIRYKGATALDIALSAKQYGVLNLLIAQGANLSRVLKSAIKKNNQAMIDRITSAVEAGELNPRITIDPDENWDVFTFATLLPLEPLYLACLAKLDDASLLQANYLGLTPFMRVCGRGSLTMVQSIVTRLGAQIDFHQVINSGTLAGATAFDFAVRSGNVSVCEYLLENRYYEPLQTLAATNGDNALHYAARNNKEDLFKLVLQHAVRYEQTANTPVVKRARSAWQGDDLPDLFHIDGIHEAPQPYFAVNSILSGLDEHDQLGNSPEVITCCLNGIEQTPLSIAIQNNSTAIIDYYVHELGFYISRSEPPSNLLTTTTTSTLFQPIAAQPNSIDTPQKRYSPG